VVLKSYFDGGNQADSTQYDRITLAAVCGTPEQWTPFEAEWGKILDQHGAKFLHTTNAVNLQKEFSRDEGWNAPKVDALIDECVGSIEGHICVPAEGQVPLGLPFSPNVTKQGLMPVTLTIPLAEYERARKAIPRLPNSITEICTSESLGFCFKWGRVVGTEWYELYFDQGEPFYGHVYDRKHNKRSKKVIVPMEKVCALAEVDMRCSPALQVADLFAWCINHNDDVRREWHARLNRLPWGSTILAYEHLMNPTPGALERTAGWNLPRRKPNK
jgi:hypothetical protein